MDGIVAQREIGGDARVRGCVDRGRRNAPAVQRAAGDGSRSPAGGRHTADRSPRRWWRPARGRTSRCQSACPIGSAATATRDCWPSRAAARNDHGGAGRPPRRRYRSNGQEVPLGDRSAPTYLLIRALAFPDVRTPKYAVIVDLPVSGQVRRQFRDETGVELTGVGAVQSADGNVRPLVARADYAPPVDACGERSAAAAVVQPVRVPRLDDGDGLAARRLDADQRGGDLRPDFRRPGRDQPAQLRAGAAAGADADRHPLPHHRVRGARRRAGAGALDHRVGARAVRRHRARPPGRLHAQDRHQRQGSARRAGRVVQLDDREHRGPAASGGGEEAARGGAAHRARDPDVAAAAGAAADAGAVGDGALRPGARGRRRLLRLPPARRRTASAC